MCTNNKYSENVSCPTYLMSAKSSGSDTLIFLAKFQDKCNIGTMDLKLCNLFHSYLSIANWYCRAVKGPTFQAMLLHQPTACTQCTQPAFTQTRSPGRCRNLITNIIYWYQLTRDIWNSVSPVHWYVCFVQVF